MAHKTLIDGTAYEITGGKTLIDGTAYSIKNGKTLIGGTVYGIEFIAINPVFANNDWKTIIVACQNNDVPDTWEVGDQKTMTVDGVDYTIDIIGKNHDNYSDGSGKAPLTFQFHDCYGTKYKMNPSYTNVGGWESSVMRTTHLPTIKALMPSEVQNAIKNVNKLTSAGNRSTTINTTADGLFLLSEVEIFDSSSYTIAGEGSQYEYYSVGNSTIKNFEGTAETWWGRSPFPNNTVGFFAVYKTGKNNTMSAADPSVAVAPAFCF